MASSAKFNLLFWVLLAVSASPVCGQVAEDLRHDALFFRKELPEFQQWLAENGLAKVFVADSVATSASRATLFLRPKFCGRNVCDSVQSAWNQLELGNRDLNGRFFHERLLSKWAFLAEVREDQAEVVVRCHTPAHFLARIYGRADGSVPVEGRSVRSALQLDVQLPEASIVKANTGDNQTLLRGCRVVPTCAKAKRFFVLWYKNKGTPVLYSAQVDTTYSFEDEFVVEVTKLSYEICPDGFFEFHRVHVSGQQQGEDVLLRWEFQGKYGSGIIFPPRKNNYKDMDLRYRTELESYQRTLFRRLLDYLRRQ